MSFLAKLEKKYVQADPSYTKDNSFGRGTYRPTFSPKRFLTGDYIKFHYYPDDEISLYTFKANMKFGITKADLETLMRQHKLLRIAMNEPKEITLYFQKPAKLVSGPE